MKYKEYKSINYPKIATNIAEFWKKNTVFEKSIKLRKSEPKFIFYEGPPSANGIPGIHHVISRTVKDIFCRYKTLKGFQVNRKGGWDAHGLPVELQVEKELGITKVDIGKKISIEDYNQKCRKAVMKYKKQWNNLTEKMGYWLDLDNPYITFEPNYMESVWSLLKKFHEKELLYKGFTIQPYSPAAGTGLSSHELSQPGTYRNVKDTTVVSQFKIVDTEKDYILAWTTTPWTLAANTALAINKKITYLKIETFNPYTFHHQNVILAKDQLFSYFNKKAADLPLEEYRKGDKLIPFKVIKEIKGSALIGLKYEQLLPYVKPNGRAFEIIEGDFVTTSEGTGIVHISPTFGADDFRVAQQTGIASIFVSDNKGKNTPIVDREGRYVKEMGEFAGLYVKNEYYTSSPPDKSLDVLICIKLKKENKAFNVKKYEHTYPHCWRTDKPILYYPLDAWFIKTTSFKDRLIALNKTIHWKPVSTGAGRFGNWLENLVDWNLSRSRYWGTPLPIWKSEDHKEEICIGSIEELRSEVEKSIKAGFMHTPIGNKVDLHRPYVDKIILVSDTGKKMVRELDLVDVWFDSGAMPYAQWHYPFENKDVFSENYPADFIAEGVDQTRGWFFTLHTISVMLFDKIAFKNVISNGLVLDQKGNKMSKRLGNAIDPFNIIATYGPDATRWYMISNANPWDNLKFKEEGVAESQRRFFGTLHNTYNFFALYANLDQFEAGKLNQKLLLESDQWILSKLNSLVKLVDTSYNTYEPTKAARYIQAFVIDDMSNWYVRLNRKRFWKGEFNEDKKMAYQTLYTCLKTISILASPIAPFYCDSLYQDLTKHEKKAVESVHLEHYPTANNELIDADLEVRMNLSQRISSLVHSLRKTHKIKVRQPLSKILIPILDKTFEAHIKAVEDLILTEVNVKELVYMNSNSSILVKKIKPNFRNLGKQYGPKMKEITTAIAKFTPDQIIAMEQTGKASISISNTPITLTLEDVEISSGDIPGWLIASEGKLTVALDTTITKPLRKEGIARDLVNRIQNIRKEINLEVQDKIHLSIEKNDPIINETIADFKDYICTEVQALSLTLVESITNGRLLEMENFKLTLTVKV